jgi:DNA replication and repair protein RecF
MHCQQLSVVNFKNYQEVNLSFSSKFNCFTGSNGSGKTNLLDAIYYLSFCKSFSNPADVQNILFDSDFFVIQGKYKINGKTDELYCGLKKQQRKVFKRNKKEYERLSDHIGMYPLVLLSPSDTQLILGGSEDRRKFIDGVISQYDKEYLHCLLAYNRALQQRNALLKVFAEKRYFDESALEIWDEQLISHGTCIFQQRTAFFDAFIPVFRDYYLSLSGGNEEVGIDYQSRLKETDLKTLLLESRKKDKAFQHTTSGIHKDDLVFLIHGWPVKKFGSQGQQKTFIIALKLAQFTFTKDIKGYHPILLFDDIFDKLDEQRVQQLMQLVSEQSFGQVFVTDTNAKRTETLFASIGAECKLFMIGEGRVLESKMINGKGLPQT